MEKSELQNIVTELGKCIVDNGAFNVEILDVCEKTNQTKFLLLSSANNSLHAKKLCETLLQNLHKIQIKPLTTEGLCKAEWVILDCSDFMIHIFTPEKREKYTLEKLWKDAKNTSQIECPKHIKTTKKK
ncbi:MAG: ribosome silencing factor [Clostridia bacterium]